MEYKRNSLSYLNEVNPASILSPPTGEVVRGVYNKLPWIKDSLGATYYNPSITNITDGYVPYRKLGDLYSSPIFTDGTNVGIGVASVNYPLHILTTTNRLNVAGFFQKTPSVNTKYGLTVETSGTLGTGDNYAIWADSLATGGSGSNVAGYFKATGSAGNNYAIYGIGDAYFSGALTAGNITINTLSPDLYFTPNGGYYNWMVAAQENVSDTFEITPSTVVNGSIYSTPVFKINNLGNAIISGTLSASNLSGTNTGDQTLLSLGAVGGSGTVGYIPKFTGASTLGNSILRDDTTRLSIFGNLLIRGVNGEIEGWYNSTPSSAYSIKANNGYMGLGTYNGTTWNYNQIALYNSGNLLIGTTTDSGYKLDVNGSVRIVGAADTLTLQKSNNMPALAFTGASNKSVIEGGDNFNFYTNGVSRMYIKLGGSVGIGTTSPAYNLDIGSSQADGIQFTYDTTQNYRNNILNYWNSGIDTRMDFNIGAGYGAAPTTIMSVGYNGNVGIGTITPNANLDIESVTGTLRLGNNIGSLSTGAIAGKIEFYNVDTSLGAGVQAYIQSRAVDNGAQYAMDFYTGNKNGPVQTLTLGDTGNVGIGISTGIVEKLEVVGNTKSNTFRASTLGLVGAPAFTFSSDPDTGIWSSLANQLDFSTAGINRWSITQAGILSGLYPLSITSSTTDTLKITNDTNSSVIDAFRVIAQGVEKFAVKTNGDITVNGEGKYTKQQYSPYVLLTVTVGATTWNLSTSQKAKVTLTGATTFYNPTNLKDGATYTLKVTQDATGGRLITWGTLFKFGSAGAPALSTLANKTDFLVFESDGTNLYYMGIKTGF